MEKKKEYNKTREKKEESEKIYLKDLKGETTKDELCFKGGYYGLFGENIDKCASNLYKVPHEYQKNQMDRDKGVHHITIFLKKEIPSLEKLSSIEEYSRLISELKKKYTNENKIFFILMSQVIISDYKDLGLGRVTKGNDEAYFKVIQWDSANDFRKKIGLKEKDFHITVGFKSSDIHDVSKNEKTLLN